MIRREHREVAEFETVVIPVYLTNTEKRAYNKIIQEGRYDEEKDSSIIASLRRFLNSTKSKLEMLKEVMSHATGKDIIYTKFIESAQVPMVDGILDFLGGKKMMVVNGENKGRWKSIVDLEHAFKDTVDVLTTTDCLSHGANFQFADRVIHFDLPYTRSVFDQRNGRVRRMGQTGDIHWAIIYCHGTIEDDLYQKVMSKGKIGEAMTSKINENTSDTEIIKTLSLKVMQ